jgi:glutathione S-transferase
VSRMSELILFVPPGRAWGTPHMSPFCAKLETYLRMAEVPHQVAAAQLLKAPKGKIPYVSIDGALVGDSQLIIDKLEASTGKPLDAGLSARAAAIGRAVRRMLEEATYFAALHLRWATDEGFAHTRQELGKLMPAPLRLLLPVIRRKAIRSVVAQGTGRHSLEDIAEMVIGDFAACAEILGDKPFLLGEAPHVCDATLYSFLEAVLRFPGETPVKAAVQKMERLVAYAGRIRGRWWKDLDAVAV